MRRVMVGAAIAVTTVALTAGVALAGEIEVVPDAVDAPGETEFRITLTDFEPDTPVFVLPCEVPESGDADDVDGDTCALDQVTAAKTDAEGFATLDLTWDVADGGVVFVAGDESRTDTARTVVVIQETRVLGTAQDDDDELADTGAETYVLIGLAIALVAAGAIATTGRRFVAD